MSENKSLKEIINFRIEKLKKIKKSEVESFPYNFKYSCKAIELIKNQEDWMDKSFKVCGRVISIRKMGKASFINIQDSQTKIQLYVKTSICQIWCTMILFGILILEILLV